MLYLIKSAGFVAVVSMIGLVIFFACANQTVNREFRNKLVLVLGYCIATSFFSPNAVIDNFAAFLTVPLFARKRTEIAPIYIFSFLVLPGIALPLGVGGTYLFVLTNILSISAGAALMALIKGGGGARSWTIPSICVLSIFTVYVLSGIRSTTATNMLRITLEQVFTLLLPFYVMRRSVRSGDDVKRIFVCMVAAIAALSTLAIYEAKVTWPLYRVIADHYGVSLSDGASVKLRGGLLRSPGPFPEPTSFAFWLSLGTFAAMTSRWMFQSKLKYLALCALLLAGMYAPQSRGAWLGLIAAYLIYQAGTGKASQIIKGVAVAGVCGVLVYAAALTIPAVAQTIGLDTTGVVHRDYRQDLWDRGLEEAQHNLILGTDIRSVLYSLRDMRQGEGMVDFVNTYLYVLLVSGLVGLMTFAVSLIAPVVVLWNRAKRLRGYDTRQLSVIAALLGSVAVMIAFTSLVGRSTMGLCVLLGIAAALSKMQPALLTPAKGRRRPRTLLDNEPVTTAAPVIDQTPAMARSG